MSSNKNPVTDLFKYLIHKRESGIFLALVVIIALISIFEPKFLNETNLFLISRQIAFTAIVALGVFYVILTSGIDLSVGSVVGLTGVVCGLTMAAGYSPFIGVIAGLGCGALVGAINGGITAYVGVTPFIVTLGMLSMARGMVFVLTKGDSVRNLPDSFCNFFNADVMHVPVVVIVLVIVSVISHFILKYTVLGRRLYAIGGNEEATELSGINVKTVKLMAYVLSGVFSGIVGVLFVARFNSAQANAGLMMELDAIAAAVIGGTSLLGGTGSVIGVIIGAMIMGVIRNGLVLLKVSSYWQQLIIGMIIVLAAIIDVLRNRKKRS